MCRGVYLASFLKMNRQVVHQLFVILTFSLPVLLASRVTITDNGYEDIVVAISSSVPADQSETIMANIKRMISQASPVLYKATYDRAYFRSVRILVPSTWSHVEANASSWETFEKADVIIDNPNPAHGDVPYTRQLGGCGDLGEFIHLSTDYVATLNEADNVATHGQPGKVFVHEWAHLRYGVFDEYGQPGDESHPLFYRPAGSNDIIPNICVDKQPKFNPVDITDNGTCKIDPVTSIYDENCRFTFNDDFKPTTSLTSYHQIDSVELFCTDDGETAHRYDAPNKHNAMCGKRSVMSVILSSPDFADKKNEPVDLTSVDTEFHIVRVPEGGARFVLVTDVSGSMALCNRIDKLRESVRAWIKNDLPVGSQLGMVKFSSRAHIVSELAPITSDPASRQALIDRIPKDLYSATCIGCGLDLASQMLAEGGPGGIILLVTDGQNSPGYHNIFDVLPTILKSGIRVITIAFGPEADKNIEYLADMTDGKSYFVHDDDTSEALGEAFQCALTYQSTISAEDMHIKLYDVMEPADTERTINGRFELDLSVGRNLKLTVFNLEKDTNIGSMELVGPDGQIANQILFDGSTASVNVDAAQAGEWMFSIELTGAQSLPLQLTITSQLLPNTSAPVTTKCWIHNGGNIPDPADKAIRIHAQVWKGSNPVVGATVRAYVEKPNSEIETFDLLDNGVYADTIPNDGVYSRFYTNATLEGRYSLKCQIWDEGSAYIGLGFIGSAISTSVQDISAHSRRYRRIPTGHFSRVSAGGSFKVELPVPFEDAYPPGHVRDLSVTFVDFGEDGNASISLKWTAPGDELDSGIVIRYELKYSDDAVNLLDSNFERYTAHQITEGIISVGSLQPLVAGSVQEVSFNLLDALRERPYYVALRAIDKAGKVSPVSNLASFFLPGEKLEEPFHEDDVDAPTAIVAICVSAVFVTLVAGTVLLLVLQRIRHPGSYKVVPA